MAKKVRKLEIQTEASNRRSARDFLPSIETIPNLRAAAVGCRGCDLYKHATQVVFGEGNEHAKLMIVGEMAGEKEDELGEPFVGPAGKLLRKSIELTDLDIDDIYFTNVVKHFKFTYMNKRKLHRTPGSSEIKACMPWLEAEINVIEPQAILCLGSTAAKSLVSRSFLIRQHRGQWFHFSTEIEIMATFHPSAILRTADRESRHEMRDIFVKDLQKVAEFLA